MKVAYGIAALIFALGMGLLTVGTAGSEEVTLLGLRVSRPIARGMGIIAMIFSTIVVLVAYGSSLPPSQARRRK